MNRLSPPFALSLALVASATLVVGVWSRIAVVNASETEAPPARNLITFAYTVNNFGYTDTCG